MRRWLQGLGLLASFAQFLAMLVYSVNRFHHYDLGIDFGIINQATKLIASGHANPYNTLYAHSYMRDEFNLLAWPLALVRLVFSSALSLLVVQALAIATASFLVINFAITETERKMQRAAPRLLIVGSVMLLVMANPLAWEADSFDFHMQPIATVGLILGLVGFWERRKLLPWVGLAIALLSGSESALLVIGLGLGMLAMKSMRRAGAGVTLLGAAWLALIMALGAHLSTPLGPSYGYLAHSANPSFFAILAGIITHPATPLKTLASRAGDVATIVASSGIIGLLFPPALGAFVMAVAANGLQLTTSFITLQAGFQNYPESMLMVAAFPIVAAWIARAVRSRNPRLSVAAAPALAVMSLAIGVAGLAYDVRIPATWLIIPPGAAAVLSRVAPPPSTEVVATATVIGRFAGRDNVFPWIYRAENIPVCSSDMEIILAAKYGITLLPRGTIAPYAARIARLPQAHLVTRGANIYVYRLTGLKPGELLQEPAGRLVDHGLPVGQCQP